MSLTKSDLSKVYWARAGHELIFTPFVIDLTQDLTQEYTKPPVYSKDYLVLEGYLFKEDGVYIFDYFSCGYGKELGKWTLEGDIITLTSDFGATKKIKILGYEQGKSLTINYEYE